MTEGRMKTYSAQSGYVYQYTLVRKGTTTGSEGHPGGAEFIFQVSADRKTFTALTVVVTDEARAHWSEVRGRELGDSELHAAAKLRLWQALDEAPDPSLAVPTLVVGPGEIFDLLDGIGV